MKYSMFIIIIGALCLSTYSNVVLDTGDISPAFRFDIGAYNNFGELYTSPHLFLAFKYGVSTATEFFGYMNYGRYFESPYSTSAISVGIGSRLALIKEGEFDSPVAAHFKIRGDVDTNSGMNLYNVYTNICMSYNLMEVFSLKPYMSIGLRYTNAKLENLKEGSLKFDETRAFITFGTEYMVTWHYSILGEITFSDVVTLAASIRFTL